ncbi:MAG: hypothetical protein AB7K67_16295, partial [Hyphomicrobiaceae bacterium]
MFTRDPSSSICGLSAPAAAWTAILRGPERLWSAQIWARPPKGAGMAGHVVPHFANDKGVEKIFIGVKEF